MQLTSIFFPKNLWPIDKARNVLQNKLVTVPSNSKLDVQFGEKLINQRLLINK